MMYTRVESLTLMHDSKNIDWAEDCRVADEDAQVSSEDVAQASNDDHAADGWQQYRRWISKAPVPRSRRSSIDPALYSWKGYRSWTEKVRRNWNDSQD